MSDERDRDAAEDEDGAEEEHEGLGLTDEFARLEEEIEQERGPREVRFDETDSTEFVVPPGSGRETDEWAAPEAFEGEEAEADAAAEAEPAMEQPADEPVAEGEPATEVHPAPVADGEEAEPESSEAEPSEGPDDGEGDGAPPEDAPPAPADAPAIEHTIVRPEPLAPRTPASVASSAGGAGTAVPIGAPPAGGDVEDRTPALWWRFLTASVVIIAATATAVSINILLFFEDVAADINPIPGADRVIDEIEPGEPQTILILGSDKRSNTPGDPGRSDTTMLLRVDAQDGVLSLFSLPRDLKVDIPGYGVGKLNEAYTVGGVKKTTKTVKGLLGIDINHIVNVDFQGFADAVDAIDCVYVDVDRDYFNDNSGLYGDQAYAAIDVNAGYQRLCGQNALDYVRYRHTDTDLVRAARQQDFLSQARRQVPVGEVLPILGGNLGSDLLDIFTQYTSSDISEVEEILETLKAFIAVRNVPVKRVSFDGTLEESFVTATPEQLDKAVEEFLGGEDTAGPTGGEGATDEKDGGGGKKERKKEEKEKDPTDGSSVISGADAQAACDPPTDKYAAFGRTSARRLRFPVYVPTAVVPGSCYDDGSRQYDIKDPDDNTFDAYKLVIEYTTPSTLPEYYGVMGTTWADPPILDDPSDTIEIGDRDYDLYYDGDRLQRIAWHDSENNSYWLSNTLLGTLDENDMLAIAKSMDEAHAK